MRLLVWALALLGSRMAHGESGSNWRFFTSQDGLHDSYTTAVSWSPRGNVWVKHGELDMLTILDGYESRPFPSIGGGGARVYESRSGQVWSVYSEGLAEFRHDRWTLHPLEPIRAEMRTNLTRHVRPVSLAPAERDHVFCLLTDRLVEFNVSNGRLTTFLRASDTGLEGFGDLLERRDGGLLITGRKGVVSYEGPVRQIRPETRPQSHILPSSFGVRDLHRPVEDPAGGVTMMAESDRVEPRVVVHFDRGHWQVHPAGSEKVRFSWQGADGVLWSQTINKLMKVAPDETGHATEAREELKAGQLFDVTGGTGGVFWMATSDGLARFTPLAWQEPSGVTGLGDSYHTVLEEPGGALWFAGASGLLRNVGNSWERTSWPSEFEPSFRPGDALQPLPGGALVFNVGEQVASFDPITRRFKVETGTSEQSILRLAGRFPDGRLAVLTAPAGAREWTTLSRWDGKTLEPVVQRNSLGAPVADVQFFHASSDGAWWLGGNSGVYRRVGIESSFERQESLRSERAYCLAETPANRVWCGAGDRVWEFDGTRWGVVGAGFERVNNLLRARDGSMWVAANNGLWRFHKGVWLSNGSEEGLPSSVVYRVWEDMRGRVWALTSLGLRQHHPEADREPPRTQLVAVERGTTASTDEPFAVKVQGRDKWKTTESDRLVFSWRLDQGAWSNYGFLGELTFHGLASGPHHVEVRCMDRNWNEEVEPARLDFMALVPWYREPRVFSVAILGFVVALGLAGLAINRHRRLVRSYAEVERIVAIRTAELERANKELLHSQKMRALGTLAAGVAHDFNSVLSIIKGSVQLLETQPEPSDKTAVRLNRIKTAVEQGAGLVRSMLGLSRGSTEGLKPCELNPLVSEVQRLFGDRFLKEATLVFEPAEPLPQVLGQGDLIKQILVNLVINASDSMQNQGQIVVRTGVVNEIPPSLPLAPAGRGSHVVLKVVDAGCGIEPEILSRIFEPFFTTKAFSTRRGTGLGLSMVYELCKEMGYGIGVESVVGQGSTFTVFMPPRKPESEPGNDAAESGS